MLENKLETNLVTDSYNEIKNLIEVSRKRIYQNVNSELVQCYFYTGKIIVSVMKKVENEQSQNRVLKALSEKLSREYGRGFDKSNLVRMKQFYRLFHTGAAVRHQLSWTHYKSLIKLENKEKIDFYISECIRCKWNTRELERQINSFYYERIKNARRQNIKLSKINNQNQLSDIIKEPFVLEFLDLKENVKFNESNLEKTLITHLQEFMLELGKGFAFVARQKRIEVDNDNYYVDLVFYNYVLKCFVLIELKTRKLTHTDIGQLDFYVRYFDNEIKEESDNPTIGIILCTDKNETIVKYSSLAENNKLYAAKYKLFIPTESELVAELKKEKFI